MEDKIRVNRVAVQICGDVGVISLCKNNAKLAEFTNIDVGIPDFYNSKIPNKALYQTYCRNTTINLLQNNGIDGYFYDEKKSTPDTEQSYCKHGVGSFHSVSIKMVEDLMHKVFDGTDISYTISRNDDVIDIANIAEKYKDGNIKYATMNIGVTFNKQYNINVVCMIKSGQVCKPKTIIFNEEEHPITNNLLRKIARGGE